MLRGSFAGDTVLYAAMAVEVMGGWQNSRTDDGPGHWHLFGDGEEAEKDAPPRLSVGKLTVLKVSVLNTRKYV